MWDPPGALRVEGLGSQVSDSINADLPVTRLITIPAGELRWRFSRSSGPGGQSVNTADSRVELSWNVVESRAVSDSVRARIMRRMAGQLVGGDIVIASSEHRSQFLNRRAALARLATTVRAAAAAPIRPRVRTRPSRGSVESRLAAKRRRSQVKNSRGRVDPEA